MLRRSWMTALDVSLGVAQLAIMALGVLCVVALYPATISAGLWVCGYPEQSGRSPSEEEKEWRFTRGLGLTMLAIILMGSFLYRSNDLMSQVWGYGIGLSCTVLYVGGMIYAVILWFFGVPPNLVRPMSPMSRS
jgi:peptidoglycan biosynthesis protein MviN/MurJ (putative lipid II flippase)